MNRKTPEEYLKEYVILPEDAEKKGAFSSYELEFIKKYLGEEALPPSIEVEGKKLGGDVQNQDSDIDLRKLKEVQLVGFAIGEREIAIPIYHVQEVIKMVKSKKTGSYQYKENIVHVDHIKDFFAKKD